MKDKKVSIKQLVILFLVWRILLFLPLVVGNFYLPYRENNGFTNMLFYKPNTPVQSYLFYPWANFDGVHYLSIAGNGYTFDGRFFPLFPLLVYLLSSPFGSAAFSSSQFVVAFLLSNILFLASIIILFKLLVLDYNEKTSFNIIVLLLVFPASFFFASIYSESLFLLLLILSFYYMRKKEWLFAALFAFLLSVTRPVGILIVIPLFFEYWLEKKSVKNFKPLEVLSLFFIPVGLLIYSFYNKIKWGDFLYFVHAQGDLGNNRSTTSITFFPQTIVRYIKILVTTRPNYYEWGVSLLELGIFVFVSLLLYIAWKKKIHSSYLLFSLLAFLMAVSTGTLSGLPRYSAVLFPAFICLSLVSKQWIKYSYVTISVLLLFILLMLFSRGYYVS